jgi:hypothetical protein
MITPAYGATATERVLPSLTLDFMGATLDPRITFTRADATATRVNASGNIETVAANTPRFDYNPVTLAIKGLLCEASATNLALQSQNFGTTWAPTRVTIAVGATSPDGTTNADRLVETATSGTHQVVQSSIPLTIGQTYRFSVYVKAAERSWIAMQLSTGFTSNPGQYFNVATSVLGNLVAGSPNARIENAGNGWYRCSIQGVASATTGLIVIYLASANGTVSYLGDVNNGLSLWGAQIELGVLETSYIPTTTTTVVRNADSAVMTGTNFSSVLTASQNGIVAEGSFKIASGFNPMVSLDAGVPNTDSVRIRGNGTTLELAVYAGLAFTVQLNGATRAAGTIYKAGGAAKSTDYGISVNAATPVSQLSGVYPTGINQMQIGGDGVDFMNGWLRTIRAWPQRLINAELQAFSK